MKLRDYQQEALESVIENYKNGINQQLVVLPTGSGKTIILSAILNYFKKKSLVIAHRKSILKQIEDSLLKFYNLESSKYYHKYKDLSSNIVTSSIQSCYRKTNEFKKSKFKILIIDEAHHSSAKMYLKLIKELNFNESSENLLIGFTATPNLLKGNNLLSVYKKITYNRDIKYMINNKYISNVEGIKIKTNISLNGIRVINKEFISSELNERINVIYRNNLIVEKYKKYSKERFGGKLEQAIAFCLTIDHAESMAKAFNEQGISSKIVHGRLKTEEIDKILNDYKKNKISVITSANILTEGVDLPSTKLILIARPTQSKTLYIQMIGRGLRLSSNKNKCVVLDFIDEYHDLEQVLELTKIMPSAKQNIEYRTGDKTNISLLALRYSILNKIVNLSDEKLDLFKIKNRKLIEEISKSHHRKILRGESPFNTPFGYTNIKCSKNGGRRKNLILKYPECNIVKEAFELASNKNNSYRFVHRYILNKYNIKIALNPLNFILKNSFYYGIMSTDYGMFPHIYPIIINKKTFDKCQNKSKCRNSSKYINTEIDNIKSGRYVPSQAPIGYIVNNRTIEQDPKKAPAIKYLYQKFSEYKDTNREISKKIKSIFGIEIIPDTIPRILKNKLYCGIVVKNKKSFKLKNIDPILSEELFNKCQKP